MAIFNQASSLETRELIWVATNIAKKRPQLNSHRSECYAREGIDGFNSVEMASLHTEYVGNEWEAKYVEFMAKWSEVA
jgi:hypothetical protein